MNPQHHTTIAGVGVVRNTYPDLWRVDIETDDGGLIHKALVVGPHFPLIHKDLEQPSHVVFLFGNGRVAEAFAWPITFRRHLDVEKTLTEQQGKHGKSPKERGDTSDSEGKEDEPPQHFYHTMLHSERAGDITVYVTNDHTWVIKSESGDQIRLNQQRREIDLLAPTIRIGSMEQTRIEYVRGEHQHLVSPIILLGTPDSDQQLVLGNIFMDTRFNPNVQVYDNHTHLNVQPGGGVSGPPVQKQQKMDQDQLSDISKTQKSFPSEEY
jgi:hypothetical protein